MEVQHVIGHQIEKVQGSSEVTVHYRGEELQATPQVTALLEQIRTLYNTKSGRGYGELDENRFFFLQLSEFRRDDIDFTTFSRRGVGELAGLMEAVPLATGGYVTFVSYSERGEAFLMVAMLKSMPGYTFDEMLNVIDVRHFNLERLHFAARINLTAWGRGDERHVSFIKGRAAEITTYFKEFVGVSEYTDAGEHTKALVNAVSAFCDSKAADPEAAQLIKSRVHGYCLTKSVAGEPLFLEDLSRWMDEEHPLEFLEYANSADLEIPDAIDVDRSKLKKLIRYEGRDRDVSVSFNSDVLGRRVRFDPDGDVLTIHPVPEALRKQLT